MARIRNYTPDGDLSGEDRLIGSSYEGEGARGAKHKTKTYKLSELAAYFSTFDSNGIDVSALRVDLDNLQTVVSGYQITANQDYEQLNTALGSVVDFDDNGYLTGVRGVFIDTFFGSVNNVSERFSEIVRDSFLTYNLISEELSSAVLQNATLTEAFANEIFDLTTSLNFATQQALDNLSTSVNQDIDSLSNSISSLTTTVSIVTGRVTTNENDITTNATSISSLGTRVTTAEANITTAQGDITSLTTTVNTNTSDISSNATSISTLGTRITTAESDISAIETDVTSLTTTVNTNTNDISTNASSISSLNTSVSTNTANISAAQTNITTLQTDVSNNSTDISTNASNISSLSTSVSTNTTNISAAQTSITNLTTTVNTNTGNISANATSISTLTTTVGNNTTSISTNQTSINGIEGRYGVTIDANGSIAGFQLLNGTNTSSSFIVTANTFEITDGTSTASPFIVTSNQVRLNVPLNGVSGTFSGALSAATGTFAGSLSAATGTFSGNLSAAGGTFSGDISGASGTFTGSLSGADITGATGTFSDTVQVGSGSGQITIDSSGISVASGDFDIDATGAASFSGTITVGGLVIDGNKVDFIETGTTTETFPLNFKDANGTIVAGIKAFGLNTTPVLDVFSNYRIQIDATDNMVLDADSFIQITSGDYISIEPIDDIYFRSTGTATQRSMSLGTSSEQFTYISSYTEDLIQLRVTDGTVSAVSELTMSTGSIILESGADFRFNTKNNQVAPDISSFRVGSISDVFDQTQFWSEDVFFQKNSNLVGEFHVGTVSDTFDQVYLYGEDILFQSYATTVGDFRIGQTIRKFNTVQVNSVIFNGEVDTFEIHPDVDNTGSFSIGNSTTDYAIINFYGNVSAKNDLAIVGALSKGSGSFKIDHPLDSKKDTHNLVHSFVESPQANNVYRGKVQLQNGSAQINLDEVSLMTEGTFEALNRDIHVYTTNESDWDAVKGNITGNILTIECQNQNSTATVSWLVIGERQDKHMYETGWTDDNGKVIVEPLKQTNNG